MQALSGKRTKRRWRYSNGPSLFDLLRGGIYHTTTEAHARGIFEHGAIVSDPPVRAYPSLRGRECQSQRTNTIAVFDFRTVERAKACAQEMNWKQFFVRHDATRVVLILDPNEVARDLIPNKMPGVIELDDGRFVPRWIPHVEAWHPGPVSVSALKAVLLYDGRGRRGFYYLERGPSLVTRTLALLARIERHNKRRRRRIPRSVVTALTMGMLEAARSRIERARLDMPIS